MPTTKARDYTEIYDKDCGTGRPVVFRYGWPLSADTWRRYYTQSMLGADLAGLEKYAEAEPLLISGYEGLMQRQNSIPAENRPVLEGVGNWIVQIYQSQGEPERAVEWRDRLSKR